MEINRKAVGEIILHVVARIFLGMLTGNENDSAINRIMIKVAKYPLFLGLYLLRGSALRRVPRHTLYLTLAAKCGNGKNIFGQFYLTKTCLPGIFLLT